jgi:radical SAM protein with 4Fe4S-binding SPASM domain
MNFSAFQSITLMVTLRCNFRCDYCFENHTDRRSDMTFAVAKKVIDAARTGATINLYGGEPLLLPYLLESIVDYGHAANKNLSFTLFTNGSLLHTADPLIRQGVGLVMSHDGLTQGTRDAATENLTLSNIVRYSQIVPDSVVKLAISPHNVARLYDNTRFLYDCGIRRIMYYFVRDPYEWRPQDIEAYERELHRVVDWYAGNLDSAVLDTVDGFVRERRAEYPCPVGVTRCGIAPNGDIYSCYRFRISFGDKYKLGSINDPANIDPMFCDVCTSKMPECVACELYEHCRIQCSLNQLRINGDMLKPLPFMCEISKASHRAVESLQPHLGTLQERRLKLKRGSLA